VAKVHMINYSNGLIALKIDIDKYQILDTMGNQLSLNDNF